MSEPLLRLEKASFGYAGRAVVHGADLAVVLVTHHHAMLRGRAGRVVTLDGGAVAEAAP